MADDLNPFVGAGDFTPAPLNNPYLAVQWQGKWMRLPRGKYATDDQAVAAFAAGQNLPVGEYVTRAEAEGNVGQPAPKYPAAGENGTPTPAPVALPQGIVDPYTKTVGLPEGIVNPYAGQKSTLPPGIVDPYQTSQEMGSFERIQQELNQQYGVSTPPADLPEMGFIPSTKRGFWNSAQQIASLFGDQDAAKKFGEYAQKYPSEQPTWKDVQGFSQGWTYLKERVGEQLPILFALAGAGVAGTVGGTAAGLSAAGAGLVGLGSAASVDALLQAGETKQSLEEAGVEPTLANVAGPALFKTGLDMMPYTLLLRRLGLGPLVKEADKVASEAIEGSWREITKGVGKGAVEQLAAEVPTEMAQQYVDIFTAHVEKGLPVGQLSPEELQSIKEAGYAAAAISLPLGGVGGGVGVVRRAGNAPIGEQNIDPTTGKVIPNIVPTGAPPAEPAAAAPVVTPSDPSPEDVIGAPVNSALPADQQIEALQQRLAAAKAHLEARGTLTPEEQARVTAMEAQGLNRAGISKQGGYGIGMLARLSVSFGARKSVLNRLNILGIKPNPTNVWMRPGDVIVSGYDEATYTYQEALKSGAPAEQLAGLRQRAVLQRRRALRAMKAVQGWVRMVAPNMKVVLVSNAQWLDNLSKDTTDTYGMQSVAEDGTILLRLDDTLISQHAPENELWGGEDAAFSVLAHEFGHAVMTHHYFTEDAKTKFALLNEFSQWVEDIKNLSVRDFFQKYDSPARNALREAQMSPQALAKNAKEWMNQNNKLKYYLSFAEYSAMQFSRWATTRERPRSVAAPYWIRTLQKLKQFFSKIVKKWQPNVTFGVWLESLADQSAIDRLRRGIPPGEIPPPVTAAGVETTLSNPKSEPAVSEGTPSPKVMIEGRDGLEEGERVLLNRQVIDNNPTDISSSDFVTDAAKITHDITGNAEAAQSLDEHNNASWKWYHKWLHTPLQIRDLFGKIPGVRKYIAATSAMSVTKNQILEMASELTGTWTRMGKAKASAVGEILLAMTQASRALKSPRRLTDSEISDLVKKIPHAKAVDAEVLSLVKKIDESFLKIAKHMEDGQIYGILSHVIDGNAWPIVEALNTAGPQEMINILRGAGVPDSLLAKVMNDIGDVRKRMESLTSVHYFPFTRFGAYYLRITATKDGVIYDDEEFKAGKTVAFYTFESKREREKFLKESGYEKEFAGKDVGFKIGKLTDQEFAYMGVPPTLMETIERELGSVGGTQLTQAQKEKLKDISLRLHPGKAFLRHLQRRRGIRGFSTDAMRVFATYFFQASNHISRLRHAKDISLALDEVKRAGAISPDTGETIDTTTIDQVHQYFADHAKYVLNPGNELAQLRALGFLWYLGGNVKSALVNLTQVPLVTYPVLAGQYGDARAIRALTGAYKDVRLNIQKAKGLSKPELEMLNRLLAEGIIDESYATEVSGIASSPVLSRVMPGFGMERLLNQMSYYGGYMFRTAEKYNRRVTGIAAFRLEMEKSGNFEAAVTAARDAIQKSQYEYAKWNRPEFMRGKKSVFFLFWQYMQHTFYLMTGGARTNADKRAAVRIWALFALMGGMQGLPFAEVLMSLFDWGNEEAKKLLGRGDWRSDIRTEIRDFLSEFVDNPDAIMHGYARGHGLGPIGDLGRLAGLPIPQVDISGSISLGSPVSGLSTLFEQGDDADKKFGRVVADALGPVAGIPYSLWKSYHSRDPNTWKNVERTLPTFLKNLSRGTRWATQGGETSASGAQLFPIDTEDSMQAAQAIAQALSFSSTQANRQYELIGVQNEAKVFYTIARGNLLKDYYFSSKAGDREGVADATHAIQDFNRGVIESGLPQLYISPSSLRRSVSQRERANQLLERGLPAERMYQQLYSETRQLYLPKETSEEL